MYCRVPNKVPNSSPETPEFCYWGALGAHVVMHYYAHMCSTKTWLLGTRSQGMHISMYVRDNINTKNDEVNWAQSKTFYTRKWGLVCTKQGK